MRLGAVGNLIAHAWRENIFSAVFELGMELTFQTQEDVAFRAPVIRKITRRIFNHAHAQSPKHTGLPISDALLARMLGLVNLGPIGNAEAKIIYLHIEPL